MIDLELSNLRLEAHAKVLDKLDPRRFNQRMWFSDDTAEGMRSLLEPHNPCGTSACCAGTVLISFPDLVRPDENENVWLGDELRHVETAATEILGLSTDEKLALFSGVNMVTSPRESAAAIRALVAERKRTGERCRDLDLAERIVKDACRGERRRALRNQTR